MPTNDPKRRSDCPLSCALDIFGDKWTLLVLRDMTHKGKQHFRELLASNESIASNILADRLKRLESCGLIHKTPDPEDGRQAIYTLTPKGVALVPVMVEISYWSAKHNGGTGAPESFVRAYETDRDALIESIVANIGS